MNANDGRIHWRWLSLVLVHCRFVAVHCSTGGVLNDLLIARSQIRVHAQLVQLLTQAVFDRQRAAG
jgi:hypothetical protein